MGEAAESNRSDATLTEHLVERQIREAMERGEFDDLEGAGRPIPDVDGNYEPDWWVRRWVQHARAQDNAWELRRRIRKARLDPPGDEEEREALLCRLDDEISAINRWLDPDERIPNIRDF